MKEILIPLNFTTTPAVYDTKQSFSTSDEASGVLTFTTTADVAGTVASLTIRNASENANRQTVLIERLDVNSSPFSYALKNPLPFGQYEGTVLLKKNLTVIASATFLFGVNSSLSAEVLPDLVKAYSLDELVENVETEVSNLKDAFNLTVSETVKGVNKTESTLQAQENVRYLNEHTRKTNEESRIANEQARIAAELLRKDTFDTLVDSAVIEQTVVQEVAEKYQEIEALNAPEMVSFRQQLEQNTINLNLKRDKSASITLNDMDAETLGIIESGTGGTPVNVLSVPRPSSVTPPTTTFLIEGKNKFNMSKLLVNTFLNYSTGTTSALAGYYTVDANYKIPVKSGVSITLSNVRVWTLFDIAMTYVSGENTGANNAIRTITPTVDGYLDVCVQSAYLNVAMVEFNSIATSYEPYSVAMQGIAFSDSQKTTIEGIADSKINSGDIKVVKSGTSFILYSELDGKEIIITTTSQNTLTNGAFNWTKTSIDGLIVHDTPDDVTPIRIFTTVGANHGYTSVIIIGMANHGKTTADLGSIWTDGVTQYTLLKIVGNNLTFGCPYTINPNGWVEAVSVAPVSDLMHVSGATSTSNVSIAILGSSPQLYPSTNNVAVGFKLDGKEIITDGTYYGNELEISERYKIMNYKEILDFAQANIGVSFANDTIPGVVEISNVFIYTKGLKCTTHHSLKALDKIRLYRCGFLQSAVMSAVNHTAKRFMPNVLAKSGWDFANGVDLSAYNSSLVFVHADSVDPNVPPNHYVDWLYDGSVRKYGFTMGYIVDKTNSKNADRIANSPNTWDMRSTKKSYPVVVEEKTLEVGDYLYFEGFRNYLTDAEVGGATNLNVVKDSKDTYVYADFNSQVDFYSKILPDDLGKNITAIQTNGLILKNSFVGADGTLLSSPSALTNGIFKVN